MNDLAVPSGPAFKSKRAHVAQAAFGMSFALLAACSSSESNASSIALPPRSATDSSSTSATATEPSRSAALSSGGAAEAVPSDLPLAAGDDGRADPSSTSSAGNEANAGEVPPIPAAAADAGSTGTTDAGETAQLPSLTIWIAGDSTVANGNTPCPRGWGGVFAPHFDPRVTVKNRAVGGRSVNTWLYDVQTLMDATGECALTSDANGAPVIQDHWQEMLDGMRPGDYLFIQFGINDGDPTCNRHVGIEAFKASYGMMAEAAQARGAQPVFLTPVSSISCNGTEARGSRGGYVPATFDAGAQYGVPVIDLHARSVALYQSLAFCPVPGGDVSATTTGPVGDFFCDDHTHFSPDGAPQIADLVVQAIREQGLGVAAYLR